MTDRTHQTHRTQHTQSTRRAGYTDQAAEEQSGLLRLVLKLDSVATGAVGALLLVASSVLDSILGLPTSFLAPIGLFLVLYAAAIMLVAARPLVNRALAWGAVLVNVVWSVDSVLLVLLGWFGPTSLGVAFVLFQGFVVALFAAVQVVALRRSS